MDYIPPLPSNVPNTSALAPARGATPSAGKCEIFTPTDPDESSDMAAKMSVLMSERAPSLTVESSPVEAPADAGSSYLYGPHSTIY